MNINGVDFNSEFFDLIYNNITSSIAIFEYIDGDFIFKDVNNGLLNLERVDKKSLIGQKLRDKFPLADEIGLYELLHNAYKTSVSQHCPRCLYESNTISSWRKYDVYKLSTGELVVIYNEKMLNDITEYDLSDIQAKLESIYESSNIGIAFTDTNGNLLTSNDSWLELIGYSIDELEGLHFSELTHEDDLKREKILFDNLKKGLVSEYRLDKRILTKRGYVKWIDLSVSAIKNSCGEIVNFVGVAVDITKQKNINRELEEQKKFLTELIENAGSMIYVKDIEGRYKIVNKKFEMCTGYKRDDILGKNDVMLFNDFISSQINQNERDVISAKKSSTFEEIITTDYTNYVEKFILSTKFPLLNAQDDVVGVCSISTDITELKTIQHEMAQSQQHLQHLFDEMPVGISLLSKNREIVYTNRKLEDMLGYTKDDVVSLDNWWILAYPDDEYRKWALENWSHSIKDASNHYGNIYPCEYNIRCKNGLDKTIEISGVVFENQILTTFVDLTDRKMYELELEHARQQADNANSAKSLFLANMSHEIRTPMNAILGLTDLLLDMPQEPKTRNYLDKIHQSSKSLLQILNDILDYSKIEANKIDIVNSEFNLRKTVDNICNLFLSSIEQKGLKFNLFISKNIPENIIADELRINQVLSNLLSNAVKFTQKGYINLSIKNIKRMDKIIRLEYAVEDSGIGISKSDIQKLFVKFSQVDDTISRKYGGTGLGLSISKQLVNLMGGDIKVVSQEGKGSKFSFTVDVKTSNKGYKSLVNRGNVDIVIESDFDLKNRKILIVEDNELNQVVISGILKRYGAEIVCANNGKEALELLDRDDYDVIFMDLHMPVMDGLQTTKNIRELSCDKANIYIIAMSAAVSKEDEELCLSYGMNDFIAKPIQKHIVLEKLSKLFSSPKTNYVEKIMSLYDIDLSQAKKYIEIFLNTSKTFEEELNGALEKDMVLDAKTVVHKMKNSVGAITNGLVFTFIKKIDSDLKNGLMNKEEILELIDMVNKLIEDVKKEIK